MALSQPHRAFEQTRGQLSVARDLWRVRILGALTVESRDIVADNFPTRRSALILIRLALAQGHPVTRDALCEELWPDEFFDVTRLRLRQELNRLKVALGPAQEIIEATRITLRLDTSRAEIDLKRAESILSKIPAETDKAKRFKLYECLAEYSGDLARDYEECWIESARASWRERAARHLLNAAYASLENKEPERVLHFARRAATVDVLNEGVQAEYLKLLMDLGRPQEAATRLADLEPIYRSVLGAGPSNRLRHLVRDSAVCVVSADSSSPSPLSACLPAPLVELIGRQEEIESIVDSLRPDSPTRLITLQGPGGVGKTELALATARRLWEVYGKRLWFVPLAGVTRPEFIGNAIQDALGITAIETDPIATISSSLSGGRSLLVLDNLEQLVDGGAQVVRRLLERCPEVKLLVTSRRKLQIEGEYPFIVPVLGQKEAVELFCKVARRTRASFEILGEDLSQVETLVSLLDRLPLAIHLAASRAGVLSVLDMFAQLSKRFELLVSTRADVEPRHQGLRQTIAWSFDQLASDAQQFLLDLSIFRGGWTAVLATEVLENSDTLRLLEELRANSFVVEQPVETDLRFNMLHSIREFGQERQSPKRSEKHLRKMSVTILRLTTEAEGHLLREDQMRWYARLEQEHDNIRRVLEFASQHDRLLGIHLCEKLWRFWAIKGHHVEARVWFRQLLPADALPSRGLGIAMFGAARCAEEQGRMNEAEEWYLSSKKVSELIGDVRLERLNDLNLVGVYLARGEFDRGRILLESTLALVRQNNEDYPEGVLRETLAIAYIFLGRAEDAVSMATASIAELSRYEDQIAIAYASLTLARALIRVGHYEEARLRIESEYEFHKRFGNWAGAGYAMHVMAELRLWLGELDEAEAACQESQNERVKIGDRFGIGSVELLLAELSKRRSDAVARSEHLRKARSHLRACGCESLMEQDLYSAPG